MQNDTKEPEKVEDHPIGDDTGAALQLAHDVEVTKNSPWTWSMMRLCEYHLLIQLFYQ